MILNDILINSLNMEINIKSMLDGIQNVVQDHFRVEKNKIKKTMDILNSLPLVIELREEIEKLKNDNQVLKDKLTECEEKINIKLEIVEINDNASLDKPEEKSIVQYFDGSLNSDNYGDVKSSSSNEEDEEEEEEEDDDNDGGTEDIDKDAPNDESDDEEDDENEFDEEIFDTDSYQDTTGGPIEIGYTFVDENLRAVAIDDSSSESHSIGQEIIERQVYKISVDNTNYYISDKLDGGIYAINITGLIGDKVGRLENGNVFFS